MDEQGGPVRVGSERENKHSRLGIASFVLAILATVLLIAAFIVGGVFIGQALQGVDPQNPADLQQFQRDLQNSPGTAGAIFLAGLGILAAPVLYLIGLVLGIAGTIQGRRKKLFAILGLIFNGLAVLLLGGLFVLGLLAGAA